MNWKSFILGVGVGLAGGYAARELLSQNASVSPEKALENAKEAFKQEGPISGSWIQMKAEPYEKGHLKYQVYKGGISTFSGEKAEQYEFIADAGTGAILDVFPLH
ncbi:PepSY domain-containing protein [Bacillus sp. ISL-47]|uniref:PepSY domain-containing protein n=1 Tax=Bacillus sp. ISL-47 TaxID=2819130 RepID=UPI001BEB7896|nr:PepSY domain-containing protein [Bacillus sp. ISL-47]MBT2690519.1 PepSY domain-containing protein [Bacillus sp. ISL-47]MBT2709399.1 PepSY domain-containing protein [Pseudomonas sp. ISL-84]